MNTSSPTVLFLAIFFLGIGGPILLLKFWGAHGLKKNRLALNSSKLANEPTLGPFDPKPEAPPGILLRRFNFPQRIYLRSQRRIWLLGYVLCSWVLFVMFCENLPPQIADSHGLPLTLAQSVWYAYLRVGFGFDLIICGFAATLFAAGAIQRKSSMELKSLRTRPLTLRFLFWSRTGLALTSLLAAIGTAALGFFLLLLTFYGPVWNHLQNAISFQGITEQHAHYVISTLQTSPLRLVLSLLTTSLLIFSIVVAIRSLPWSFTPCSNSTLGTVLVFLYWMAGFILLVFLVLWGNESLQLARVLFLYNHKNVEPAPPYAYALLPTVIAAALLRLAQLFSARKEIS